MSASRSAASNSGPGPLGALGYQAPPGSRNNANRSTKTVGFHGDPGEGGKQSANPQSQDPASRKRRVIRIKDEHIPYIYRFSVDVVGTRDVAEKTLTAVAEELSEEVEAEDEQAPGDPKRVGGEKVVRFHLPWGFFEGGRKCRR